MRSDRGGEYYGRYIVSGQLPGPFATFLKEEGIIAQYSMPDTPQQNGVAERRNQTLMDMVRSILGYSSVPIIFWSEAIKTAVYILNRVPSKAITKTLFELWKGWKPSLRHTHIWGCPSEVRVYNPHLKKLDTRIVSCFFIGYAESFKGYRFYCSTHIPKIIEARNAKFLEGNESSGSDFPRTIEFEEIKEPVGKSIGELVAIPRDIPTVMEEQSIIKQPFHEEQIHKESPAQNSLEQVGVRRSLRIRKSTISSDYLVYLQESDFDVGPKDDPSSFSQAMSGSNSTLWLKAMQEEMKSMAINKVWI